MQLIEKLLEDHPHELIQFHKLQMDSARWQTIKNYAERTYPQNGNVCWMFKGLDKNALSLEEIVDSIRRKP